MKVWSLICGNICIWCTLQEGAGWTWGTSEERKRLSADGGRADSQGLPSSPVTPPSQYKAGWFTGTQTHA